MKSLSIVIPCHSRVDLLAKCLESLVRFAPPQCEILVVDDGSINGVVSETVARFPGIQSLRRPTPGGFAIAANAGIRATSGEVVELLNDDTQVTEGWAESALKWFDDSSVAAVAPLVLKGPSEQYPPVIDSIGDEYHPGGFARKRGHGQRLSQVFLNPCEVFGASASSALYRRSALEEVGLFPEDFGAYFEDVDLACRLRRAGYRTMCEPGSRVWHRVGASYGRRSRKLLEMQSRNEERIFWRNLSREKRARTMLKHLAVLGGKAIRRVREGQLLPWLTGRLRAWGTALG